MEKTGMLKDAKGIIPEARFTHTYQPSTPPLFDGVLRRLLHLTLGFFLSFSCFLLGLGPKEAPMNQGAVFRFHAKLWEGNHGWLLITG